MDMLRQLMDWLMPLDDPADSTTSLNALLERARRAQYAERYEKALNLLNEADELAKEQHNTTAEVDISLTRADILIAQQRYDDAHRWLTALKDEVEGRQHRAPLAYTLCSLGQIAQARHQLEKARDYFDRARKIASEVSAKAAEGRAACHLADVYLAENNASYADYLFKDAVTMLQKSGDRELLGYFLARMGQAQSILGRRADGEQAMQRGLEIAQALKHQAQIRQIHTLMGDEAHRQGDPERARQHYQKALERIPDEAPTAREHTALRLRLCRVALYLNDAQTALSVAQQALTDAQQTDDEALLQRARVTLGMALHYSGDSEAALPYLEEALNADSTADNSPAFQSELLRTFAAAQAATDQPDSAEAIYQKAIDTARPDSPEFAQAHTELGAFYAQQQQLRDALDHWQQALSSYETLSQAGAMARLYCQMADARLKLDNPKQALTDYEAALVQVNHVENKAIRADVLTQVAIAYTDYGRNIDTADEFFREALSIVERTENNTADTDSTDSTDDTPDTDNTAPAEPDTATVTFSAAAEVHLRGHYGRFLTLTGQPKKAITEIMQARNQASDHALKAQQAVLTMHLGQAYQQLGDREKALSLYENALDSFQSDALADALATQPEIRAWLALLHGHLGDVYAAQSRTDDAQEHYQQAQQTATPPRRGQGIVAALTGFARLALDAGDTESASDHLENAYQQCKRSSLRREMVDIYEQQSRLYSLRGESAKAKAAWNEAKKLRSTLQMPATEATWL
jgi:tetratricopeptide (TPR) repeat protein